MDPFPSLRSPGMTKRGGIPKINDKKIAKKIITYATQITLPQKSSSYYYIPQ